MTRVRKDVDIAVEKMRRNGSRGRLPQSRFSKFTLFGEVPFNDLSEQPFLVTESEVETRRRDPDRCRQIAKRRALIAILPEEARSLLDRVVKFKFARSTHRRQSLRSITHTL